MNRAERLFVASGLVYLAAPALSAAGVHISKDPVLLAAVGFGCMTGFGLAYSRLSRLSGGEPSFRIELFHLAAANWGLIGWGAGEGAVAVAIWLGGISLFIPSSVGRLVSVVRDSGEGEWSNLEVQVTSGFVALSLVYLLAGSVALLYADGAAPAYLLTLGFSLNLFFGLGYSEIYRSGSGPPVPLPMVQLWLSVGASALVALGATFEPALLGPGGLLVAASGGLFAAGALWMWRRSSGYGQALFASSGLSVALLGLLLFLQSSVDTAPDVQGGMTGVGLALIAALVLSVAGLAVEEF